MDAKKKAELLKDFKPKAGHKMPVTRRDFLQAGLIQSMGVLFAPTVLDILLNNALAEAGICPAAAAAGGTQLMPAFITINLQGGGCLAWDFAPTDVGGNPLTSYSTIGLGTAPAMIAAPGYANPVRATSVSTTWPAINAAIVKGGLTTAAVLPNAAVIPICSTGQDDSSSNPMNICAGIVAAGLTAKLSLLSTSSKTMNAVPALGINPLTPFVPSSVTQIVSALGAPTTGAFGTLATNERGALMNMIKNISDDQARRLASVSGGPTVSDAIGCANMQNIPLATQVATGADARSSTIAGVFGLTAATSVTDKNAINGSMVLAALSGNSGPAVLNFGGWDYHDNDQVEQNTMHTQLGTIVGQILASAKILSRSVYIYVCTDGATASNNSATGAPPNNDSGERGLNYVVAYNPLAVPLTVRNQVGYFDPKSQQNATASPTNSIQLGASAAFLNYLIFSKKGAGMFNTLVPGQQLTPAQIQLLSALV